MDNLSSVMGALSHPSRRAILARLSQGPARVTEIAEPFDMSLNAVSKHLKVLEGAGLVTTRKRGREKLHFLNPVPIREVHDRWVSKYAEPWASALTGLKRDLEKENQDD